MTVNHYFLNKRILGLKTTKPVCVNCPEPKPELKLGDPVVSKRSGSGLRRLYCEPCALALYLIDEPLEVVS